MPSRNKVWPKHWKVKAPTEPGWYWGCYERGEVKFPVKVFWHSGNLWAASFTTLEPKPLADFGIWWGPRIKEPE